MRVHFSLRSLLLAVGIAALYLGLQMHVSQKANQLIKEMRDEVDNARPDGFRVKSSQVTPLSIIDVIFIRRRCEVVLSKPVAASKFGEIVSVKTYFNNVFLYDQTHNHDMIEKWVFEEYAK